MKYKEEGILDIKQGNSRVKGYHDKEIKLLKS